jgi:hypothetical protein
MALDLGDKAIIREIAYEVAVPLTEKLSSAVKEGMATQVKIHLLECPVRHELISTKEELDAIKNKAKGGWHTLAFLAALIVSFVSLATALWIAYKTH